VGKKAHAEVRNDKTGSCHLFRHSCATDMHRGGADIRYVQEMLGHTRMETTQIYTHVNIDALAEVHSRTHPHGRLEKQDEELTFQSDDEAINASINMPACAPHPSSSSGQQTVMDDVEKSDEPDEDPPSGGSPINNPKPPPKDTPPSGNQTPHECESLKYSQKSKAFEGVVMYYGYRFYDPETGRWPSRDPIEEQGGVNLYGFVGNDGVNFFDLLGLDDPWWVKRNEGLTPQEIAASARSCMDCHGNPDVLRMGFTPYSQAWFNKDAFERCSKILVAEIAVVSAVFVAPSVPAMFVSAQTYGASTAYTIGAASVPWSYVANTAVGTGLLSIYLDQSANEGVYATTVEWLMAYENTRHGIPTIPYAPNTRLFLGNSYPSRGGNLRLGAFEANSMTLGLGKGGHFDGAAEAGLKNISPLTHRGITMFDKQKQVFWANDSLSLPIAITKEEAELIQKILQIHFQQHSVKQVKQIGDAFK
jgi:RHS repeat-associated protein